MSAYVFRLLTGALLFWSVGAKAQVEDLPLQSIESPNGGAKTEFSWQIKLAPSFGKKGPFEDNRFTNTNAIAGEMSLSHEFAEGLFGTATGRITANPDFAATTNLVGAEAAAEIKAGKRFYIGREAVKDKFEVYGTAGTARGFESKPDTPKVDYDDRAWGAGLEFRDALTIHCVGEATRESGCTEGWAWQATGGYKQVRSDVTDRDKDVWALTGSVDLPFARFALPTLNLQAGFERTDFQSRLAPSGRRRADETATVFAGLNVTRYLTRIPQLQKATVGAKYTKNWSNDPGEQGDRLQIQFVLAFGGKETAFDRR